MTLVAGSYERFLFGYSYFQPDTGAPAQLSRRFTHAAHKGVVKCLAAAGQFVASGGADDLIHLYDLKGDKDLSFLMNPGEGAVTSLSFFTPKGGYNPTHLLSGSADGSVSVWSVGGGWECMKTMRGHKKEVSGLSVHPSGAIALTSSRDGTIRMWDLVKGRSTFSSKLEAEAEGVQFSPTGLTYALLCGTRVTLHSITGQQGLVGELPHPRRALCLAFSADGTYLVTGAEDGSLRVWSTKNSQEILCIPRAHATRIRGLALPSLEAAAALAPTAKAAHPSAPGLPTLVATASSDGVLKLWDLTKAQLTGATPAAAAAGVECVGEAATTARLTSLCTVDPPSVMAQHIKRSREHLAAKQHQQGQQQGAGGGKAARVVSGTTADRAGAAQQAQQKKEKKKRTAGDGEGLVQQQQPSIRKQQQRQQEELQEDMGRPAKKRLKPASPAVAAAAGGAGGSQRPPKAAGIVGKASAASGAAGIAAAGAKPAGVSHDGVVDFMDAKDWQKVKQKRKKQQRQQREGAQAGGGGGAGAGRRQKVKGKGQRPSQQRRKIAPLSGA